MLLRHVANSLTAPDTPFPNNSDICLGLAGLDGEGRGSFGLAPCETYADFGDLGISALDPTMLSVIIF